MKGELMNKLCEVETFKNDEVGIIELVNDIGIYLQIGNKIETNQVIIRYENLFHRFIMWNWQGNINDNRYEDYNKIIVKCYVLYYKRC